MPYLIDGNNLLYALRNVADYEAGRLGLCVLLKPLVARKERVTIVFDGPDPPPGLLRQMYDQGVSVYFSGPYKADDLIIGFIREDSAPKRLTVVSTDREIRVEARKRRCIGRRSEEFVEFLARLHDRPGTRGGEPREKYRGLNSASQRDRWMRDLGFDPSEGPDDDIYYR